MFFKLAVLKRMLKDAYKKGLTVGCMAEDKEGEYEGYYISSGWWVMWFSAGDMPKEAKAAIIELCGDLPGLGEVFTARKGMGNQYELEQKGIFNLPDVFKRCTCRYRVTKLSWQQGGETIRFLQEDGRELRIKAVSEIFMALIDPEAVDRDRGEEEPEGPVAFQTEASFMCRGNSTCYLMAGIRTTDNEDERAFWRFLEGTEIL